MDEFFNSDIERRIWRLHHEGYSIPEIAQQLGVPLYKVRSTIAFGWACEKSGR